MRILMLDIDTLRPDHMSCYGYHRLTTPNMDQVCAQGVRFDRCYSSDAPCMPARRAGERHVRHPQRRSGPWLHRG